jgi:anhydro-N-acetylmuramic acid kinase
MNKSIFSIGLMSGTSMDAIDAALLETDGSAQCIKDLGHTTLLCPPPFKILLKAAEYHVRKHHGRLSEAAAHYPQDLQDYLIRELKVDAAEAASQINELSSYLNQPLTLDAVIRHSTDLHASAVNHLLTETGYSAAQIGVIGYHGQTLLHQPEQKISVIVGDGQRLADLIGTTVVNDFRSRDIAAGGQGAPFAPLYHFALAVRDRRIPLAVVNCGGIANITVIPSADESCLTAFDTGPGNGLIDRLVRQRTGGKEVMDTNGQYGSRGTVHPEVLTALYAECIHKNGRNYFLAPPPKSLDIGDLTLIPALDALSLEDACATAAAFTADAIVYSLKFLQTDCPPHWVLAGGGWRNPVIRRGLEERLRIYSRAPVQIQLADEIGWNAQAMEAQIFAYLAVRSLQGKPLSLPQTTGVPHPLCGGQIWRYSHRA